MTPEVTNSSDKNVDTHATAEHKNMSALSLCADAYGFAVSAVKGFKHDVVKPFVGLDQIASGKTGAEIDPHTADQSKAGYVFGAMAGQAADFLAVQVVAKRFGLNAKATTILTSGALAALTPTEAGGMDLKERTQNFVIGATSMAAYGKAGEVLSETGLRGSFGKNLFREASSGAFAGLVAAESTSILKDNKLADGQTTAESMLGWAATGAAFHAVGAGAGKLSAELKPELMARTGRLEATDLGKDAPTATREFVITSNKEALDTFKQTNARGVSLQVRELLTTEEGGTKLGSKKNMFVQHLSAIEGDSRLLPNARTTDILATCHPENLSDASQAMHVFGKAEGNVWLYTGENNRLLLSAGDVPINVTNVNGYKESYKLNHGETTIHAMAPLLVGNPSDMNSDESKAALNDFRRQLTEAKKLRIDGVSMDLWWGMIGKEKGKFDFSYFHSLTDEVIKAGLDVATVLSFHQCGGNVGDTENIPIPQWVWKDVASKLGSDDVHAGMYKSEQGNYSPEYIQLWADKVANGYYTDVMKAYRESFADKAPFISEINVSLGPSGEMRYPSYNSHDSGAGYPTRGSMQAYSDLAVADFKNWSLKKYGGIDGVGKAWNIDGLTTDNIRPPSDTQGFYDRNDHKNTQYGRDLIDWYNDSLVNHGKTVLTSAIDVFGAKDSPFTGTSIGAKVPGVHWRMGWRAGDNVYFSDRAAETNAGLIQTSSDYSEQNAYGYQNILNMFKSLQPLARNAGTSLIPSYTCLELPDGQDGAEAQSLPHTAATRFGQAAIRMGLRLKGENALSGTLYNGFDWDLMNGEVITAASPNKYYSGLTLLRLHDIVDNQVGRDKITSLINAIHAKPETPSLAFPAVMHALRQSQPSQYVNPQF